MRRRDWAATEAARSRRREGGGEGGGEERLVEGVRGEGGQKQGSPSSRVSAATPALHVARNPPRVAAATAHTQRRRRSVWRQQLDHRPVRVRRA